MTRLRAPSPAAMNAAARLLDPFRKLTRPVFVGLDKIPEHRPLLFVGNHTLFGVIDVPFFFAELWEKKGIALRALGHHAHFKIPVWGPLLRSFGVVDGTRENASALMKRGEALLVFPGGSREVAKRKGERYALLWKDRLGFARLALQHRCTIVPFAAIGVEDAFHIVIDGDDLLRSPVGRLADRLGLARVDFVPPIVAPEGIERLYFRIEDPIDVSIFGGRDDDDAARELRDRTRAAIQAGIASLFELRRETERRAR